MDRLRSSASLRLGVHLTSALRDPRRLPFLPATFPLLALRLGLEALGRLPPEQGKTPVPTGAGAPAGDEPERGPSRPGGEGPPAPANHSIVLFPTNGVGFGHFTRLYAVARRLRAMDPDLEIVFFTPMPALHVPHADGFATYHLSGRSRRSAMGPDTWNMLLEEMLRLVLETHRPRWFLFDGSIPYPGMLRAIRAPTPMETFWLRRGMLKRTWSIPADSAARFDWIVHPEDAVPVRAPGPMVDARVLRVPPITLIEEDEMWPREKARERLGVPPDARAVYVQLGAGRINDIASEVRRVVDALLAHPGVHVVLGESMLGKRLDVSRERLHLFMDYPNALYLKAFDASVQAGGYNSFHEMRRSRLPTLFLPNRRTGQDDQFARCAVAEREGWGLVNRRRTSRRIRADVARLLSLDAAPAGAAPANGARALSEFILSRGRGRRA